jgi:hypothetical protein
MIMKNARYPEPILNQPICELKVNEKFKEITKKYGYHTLADMLRVNNPYSFLEHPGFGYRMLTEFVNFLEKYRLGHYLN